MVFQYRVDFSGWQGVGGSQCDYDKRIEKPLLIMKHGSSFCSAICEPPHFSIFMKD